MRLLGLLLVLGLGVATAEKVVCYFGSWATWRPGDGKFDVEDIDPFLCTHIIFGFAGLSNHTWTIEVLDPWNELCPGDNGGNNCAYDRFVALKNINPDLSLLLAVGGWNEGSADYSVMAADPAKRKTFIDSTMTLVTKHRFDGFDMDWEYPTKRGGAPEDKENFITLMAELNDRLKENKPPLLLTAAVHCCKPTVDDAYMVPDMYELLDQVHVMSYDMHGAWENFTHHNAPLCGHPDDYDDFLYYNLVESINYHLSLGAPKDKLVMGIPVYGRCFTLDDINQNGIWAPASEPGAAGPYIRIPGTLGFNEICERLKNDDCTVATDPSMYEPYFYCPSDNIWCGFDDAKSVATKARYVKNMGLSGVLVWTIDTDDFKPKCYEEDFHLLRSAKRAVDAPADGIFPDCQHKYWTTTTGLPTTTTSEPTTPEPTVQTTSVVQTTPSSGPTIPTDGPTTPGVQTTPSSGPTIPTDGPTTPTSGPVTTPSSQSTTPGTGGSTPKPPHPRPDCSQQTDGSTFPHEDCNKFWVCLNHQAILEQCGPGTLFDENLSICNWESDVDTSNCNLWICEVDNTYYPHPDCDKYYWCYDGSPHVQQCSPGTFWNQYILQCDKPINVNISQCNVTRFLDLLN